MATLSAVSTPCLSRCSTFSVVYKVLRTSYPGQSFREISRLVIVGSTSYQYDAKERECSVPETVCAFKKRSTRHVPDLGKHLFCCRHQHQIHSLTSSEMATALSNPPGTVLLEGMPSKLSGSMIAYSNPFFADLHQRGRVVLQPQPSSDPNDPLVCCPHKPHKDRLS